MATEAAPPGPRPPADAAALPEGYRLDEFVFDRPLGGGGFGVTYHARDSNLQLPVAIKEYFPSDLVTRGAAQEVLVRGGGQQEQYDWGLERFLDEARALATFRHPNIVRVLRYFRANGTAYIVMEYESGHSLKRWVPQNAPISRRTLLSLIYPLLDGLEAVHRTGFLHRDIKPDNIYVRADGSPVLLDFGAARRVSSERDMTNIVSPGFAPFEQYHSQGNQGPWTDIYSVGAVMYWMTTGKKPVESASRVRNDTLMPAATLADASVYGAPLLEAIDWAMQPDESRRPQTVGLFRSAIHGSEQGAPDPIDIELDAERSSMAAAGSAPSVPQASSVPTSRRNLVCTIMFVDIVGYSQRSVDDQVAVRKLFNDLLSKALRGMPEESRITLDSGDGAAVCFMGDPEEALQSAMLLRDLLAQRRSLLTVRIGLHMGPVRIVSDMNERVNVVGDGFNVAQRVMDFAQANQVLVSRSYFEVISRITDDTADLFQYLGQHEDRHGRLHEVYSVAQQRGSPTTAREGPSTGFTQTLPVKTARPLDPEVLHEIEADLARHIGPLARILTRKAQPLAATPQALREALAPSIQDAKSREAFLAGSNSQAHADSGRRGPASRPPASTSLPSQFGDLPRTQPKPSTSILPSQPHSPPSHTRPPGITPEEMAAIEQALGKYIGPMARMLVKMEAGRTAGFRQLVEAVAANIDQAPQREQFMQALKKALPRRPH